jgi:hypothetical protein
MAPPIVALALSSATAADKPSNCDAESLCAAEHSCDQLQGAIDRDGETVIEFVSGYTHSSGRGRTVFQSQCDVDERHESWKVLAKDGEVCELRYVCVVKPPESAAGS